MTLIETLVVVFIIGLLIAMLLPAIMSARESARRLQCMNNLKQLGLAINNYSSRVGCMPYGMWGASIHVILLPDLEQQSLYSSFNYSRAAARDFAGFLRDNMTAKHTQIDIFLCPSDVTPVFKVGGLTNYAGNLGTWNGSDFVGSFTEPGRKAITLNMIGDGLSNTVAMTEWLLGAPSSVRDPRRTVLQTGKHYLIPDQLSSLLADCNTLTPTRNMMIGKGNDWSEGAPSTTLYNHLNPINGRSCTNAGSLDDGVWSAGSTHPGGCYSVFVDGHVQFIKESTKLEVWRALSTRSGGEVLGTLD